MTARLPHALALSCWLLLAAPFATAVESESALPATTQLAGGTHVVTPVAANEPGDTPAGSATRAPPMRFGVPGAVEPGELWKDFLSRGSSATIAQMSEVIERIEGAASEPSIESCQAEAVGLREINAHLPVSIALWHLAYECAELQGEEAEADTAMNAVAALSRHALALNPAAYSGAPPIPIVHEADATAMIKAMGLEPVYAYFDPISDRRYLRLHIGAADPADGSERQFQFDFIEVWMQLHRDEPKAEFPAFRASLVQAYLSHNAQLFPGSIAEQALRVVETLGQDDPDMQRAQFIAAASQGNLLAGLTLAEHCMHPHARGCGGSTIDALLPLAEREYTPALLDLSIAYDLGKGIRLNRGAADTLWKRVKARMGEQEAVLTAARRSLRLTNYISLSPPMRQRVVKLANAGIREAQAILATRTFAFRSTALKADEESALLADSGSWHMPLHFQARWLDNFGNRPERALAVHRAAAERGGAESVIGLARHMALNNRVGQEPALEAALKAAGHAGDPGSMAALGERLEARGDKRRALGWFVSAQQRGSLYGATGMARAMARGEAGSADAPKKAVELLRALSEAEFVPARHTLALLLLDGVEGVEASATEAADLLMANVRENHAPSIRVLAEAVLFGSLSAPRGFKAEKALRDLSDARDPRAKYLLAKAIYHLHTQQPDAEEALRLLRESADANEMDARNDLAWISCTSQRGEYFEPARGLQAARSMAMEPQLTASNKDTVAACHAANGEFERAVELMREVVASNDTYSEEQRGRHADRLQRFERGEAYRESR